MNNYNLNLEIAKLSQHIEELYIEFDLISAAVAKLQFSIDELEQYGRRNCIILHGLDKFPNVHSNYCGDYLLVGRCWTSCNLFPIRNLAVSQHAPSIVQFFIFLQSFPTFCYFVYHLLLRPGTGRFFRNRRCDFQQSNVAMLVFFFFCIHLNSLAYSKYTFALIWLSHRCVTFEIKTRST